MPLLIYNIFWASGTPATRFRWLRLHPLCGATSFGSHQLHLHSPVFQSLVGLRSLTSVCNAWHRSRAPNLQRVGKNCGPIVSLCRPEILGRTETLVVSSVLSDCLIWRVSFRRHSPISLRTKCNSFLPQIVWGGTTLTFLQ